MGRERTRKFPLLVEGLVVMGEGGWTTATTTRNVLNHVGHFKTNFVVVGELIVFQYPPT